MGSTLVADPATGADSKIADPAAGATPTAAELEAKAAADKVTADKAAADAAAEAAKAKAPKVPDKYNLKLPEASTLDASALERTAAIARALGLPDDAAAQKVVDLVHQEAAAREAAVLADHAPGGAAWTKQVDAWKAETLADPALGATPAERTAAIQKGHGILVKYGEQHPAEKAAMTEFLNNSGLGDHPAANRFFAWLGKVAGELPLVAPGVGSAGTVPVAQKIYPTMNP